MTLQIEEGRQYRLGNVRFKPVDPDQSVLAFSESALRQHLQTKRGDLFDVSKVRRSLDEIMSLYANKGYIDMVPTPEVLNDDDSGQIDLVMKIDEGMQYRFGKIEFLGLNENSQNELETELQPGQLFKKTEIDELLKRYKSLLPADVSPQDAHLKRNAKQGVVDVTFDFYSCPQPSTARANSW